MLSVCKCASGHDSWPSVGEQFDSVPASSIMAVQSCAVNTESFSLYCFNCAAQSEEKSYSMGTGCLISAAEVERGGKITLTHASPLALLGKVSS